MPTFGKSDYSNPPCNHIPCSSVWMCLASLCNMLFPTCVLPSAGMRKLSLCSIWKLVWSHGQAAWKQFNYWHSLLSFDLVNVVPCSVKKTTVIGCPCRSDTYCNRVTEEHVKMGSLVWLDHWIGGSAIYESEDNTHRGKATNKSHEIWIISMKNQTLHSAPWPRVLERPASQMTTQITPIRESHGPCRETSEKRVRTATSMNLIVVSSCQELLGDLDE